MRVTISSAIACLAFAGVSALLQAPAQAQVMKYKAVLNSANVLPAPANQVPPKKPSDGTGTADITYDPTTKILSWTISFTGLSGPATSIKFHSPAPERQIAIPTLPIYGNLDNPVKGDSLNQIGLLPPAMAKDLDEGRMYLQISTSAQPLGEIRGQVVKAQ